MKNGEMADGCFNISGLGSAAQVSLFIHRRAIPTTVICLVNHILSNLRLPVVRSLEAVRVCLVVLHSLDDLVATSDHERSVLNDRLSMS